MISLLSLLEKKEAQKPNEEAQGATDLSNKRENTNASEFGEITGDGSSPGVPGTTQGEQSGMVPSAEYGGDQRSDSLKAEEKEGVPGSTQGEQSGMVPSGEYGVEVQRSDSLKEEANEGVPGTTQGEQSGMVPSAEYGGDQRSDSLKAEEKEGVAGTTPGEQSGMVPSAEYGVEQKSDSLKEEANEDEEPKTEIQVTDHDNWASQREEGPGPIPDLPEEASRTMSSENGSTTQPTTNSPGEALKLKATEKLLKSNNETPAATDTSIITSKKTGNTNASGSEGTGSNSGIPGTTQGELSETVSSAETRVHQKSDSSEDGSSTQPTTDSPSEALKLKATEKVQMSNDQIPAANNNPIITSEKTVGLNTDASRSEGTGSSSVNEPMKEPPATKDNGASQPEGGVEFQIAVDTTSGKTGVSLKIVKPKNSGENRAPPPENKQGSENLQSKSGSSAPGGKCAEETEAQQIDAKGKSNKEEEKETGAGANKDDDKEVRLKEKKAKGEGVEGEGGTTDAVKTMQHVIKERSVSISICSSAYSFNVEGLVSYLNRLMKKHPELIKKVKFHELPYNDLDHYQFNEENPVDVMILCHSINNRRFAITDVMDALYDEYLPYCARVVGKEKMGVIVHDFDDMRETVQSSRMSSFKYKQPKAFETTSLQITCGHIEKEEQVRKQMLKEDRKKIFEFLKNASKHPEKIITLRDIETTGQKAKRIVKQAGDTVSSFFSSLTGSNEAQRSSTQKAAAVSPKYSASDVDTGETKPDEKLPGGRKNNNSPPTKRARDDESQPSPSNAKRKDLLRSDPSGDVAQVRQQSHADFSSRSSSASGSIVTSAPQRSLPQPTRLTEPRSTSVSICSSAYQHNVKGLLSWFTKFQAKQPHMINDVRFRSLPYNDIDSFRFPPDDPVDVMVLCHSVNNRGFSITNVLNALYEKYLKYCHDVIGKKKLAVIVHDFTDLKPSTVKSRMKSFRRSQPLTFDFVDTAIVCGSLEDPAQLGMTEEDKTGLICFLERARLVPEENTELKQSVVGRLKNFFFD